MFLFWRFISIADHSWSHSNCSLQSYDKSQPFLKSKQFLFVPCVRKPCWWMWINKRNLSLKFWLTISDLKKTNKDSSVEAGMQICVRDTKLACRGDNSLSLGILYFCILVLREILYRASAIHRSDRATFMLNWSKEKTEQSRSTASGRAADWMHLDTGATWSF